MRCPKCGSNNVRDSYVKDCARVGGMLAVHVAMMPGHALGGLFNNPTLSAMIGKQAKKAGGRLAEACYNKAKCKNCGHSWFYEMNLWESK